MDIIGELVHFEFTTADATTAAPIVIYNQDGAARPLQAGERLVISDIHVSGAAAMTVDIYNGVGASPAAGERLFNIVTSSTIGTAYPSLGTPAYSKKNITPLVKASAAGVLTVIGTGVIAKV
jgi:hypothetical protein